MSKSRSKEVVLLLAGLLLTTLTALYNIGFIALDDYYLVASVIPAKLAPALEVLAATPNVHPWVPKAILRCVVWPLWKLGIENPVLQIRFAMAMLSFLNFLVIAFSLLSFFPREATSKRQTFLLLLAFYFASPLFFSRPMVETLSMPWLIVSLVFVGKFWRSGNLKALAVSVLVLSLGSVVRFQIGVCWFAILLLVALRKNRSAWGIFALSSVAGFFITGFNDWYWTGIFHRGIRAYLAYNLEAGGKHGVMGWYVFLVLTVALTLPPTFFSKYRRFPWKVEYTDLFVAVVFFAVFLVTHSLSPHKEERFLIPILPVLLVLMTPALNWFRGTWRWRYFWSVNAVLLVVATTSVAQQNVLGLMQYLGKHSEIKKVYGVDEALVLFPVAYLENPIPAVPVLSSKINAVECPGYYVFRKGTNMEKFPMLKAQAEFAPSWVENLVVKANPKQNIRRSALVLYSCKP